jgi:YHS domain-containing protein
MSHTGLLLGFSLLALCGGAGGAAGEPPDTGALRAELAELKAVANSLLERIRMLESRLQQRDEPSARRQEPVVSDPTHDPAIRLGLNGYCPVTLVEQQQWVLGSPQYHILREGCTYWLAGPKERETFQRAPERFVPVLSGYDPVLWLGKKQLVPGDRRHGVFYDDAIWLFSTEDTLGEFTKVPTSYLAAKFLSVPTVEPVTQHGGEATQRQRRVKTESSPSRSAATRQHARAPRCGLRGRGRR